MQEVCLGGDPRSMGRSDVEEGGACEWGTLEEPQVLCRQVASCCGIFWKSIVGHTSKLSGARVRHQDPCLPDPVLRWLRVVLPAALACPRSVRRSVCGQKKASGKGRSLKCGRVPGQAERMGQGQGRTSPRWSAANRDRRDVGLGDL